MYYHWGKATTCVLRKFEQFCILGNSFLKEMHIAESTWVRGQSYNQEFSELISVRNTMSLKDTMSGGTWASSNAF